MSALNALKHGGYAQGLPERLLQAGHRESAEFYQTVRAEIEAAFSSWQLGKSRLDQLANQVWAMARRAGVLGKKPDFSLLAPTPENPSLSPLRVRMDVPGAGFALVYWVQKRKRGIKDQEKLIGSLVAGETPEDESLRFKLESKVRRRVVGLPKTRKLPRGLRRQISDFESFTPAITSEMGADEGRVEEADRRRLKTESFLKNEATDLIDNKGSAPD